MATREPAGSELWQEPPWAWGAVSGGWQSLTQPGTLQLPSEVRAGRYLPQVDMWRQWWLKKVLSPSGRRKNERDAWFSANCGSGDYILFK